MRSGVRISSGAPFKRDRYAVLARLGLVYALFNSAVDLNFDARWVGGEPATHR
jgi:hypothetical protein